MQNLSSAHFCFKCKQTFTLPEGRLPYINIHNLTICDECYLKDKLAFELNLSKSYAESEFNEPAHYHKHEIDTIEFLKRGFPPEVCMGFFLGSIVKYAQRAEYKNGREDFVKLVDYAKRALDWYDETHK